MGLDRSAIQTALKAKLDACHAWVEVSEDIRSFSRTVTPTYNLVRIDATDEFDHPRQPGLWTINFLMEIVVGYDDGVGTTHDLDVILKAVEDSLLYAPATDGGFPQEHKYTTLGGLVLYARVRTEEIYEEEGQPTRIAVVLIEVKST
jgi:hypothetical protein